MAQYGILQFDMNFRSLFHNPCVKSALFLPSRCFGACFVPFSRWVETNYTKDGCVSVIEHYRLWHHRVTGAYKIHKYIESCSTYRGFHNHSPAMLEWPLWYCRHVCFPQHLFLARKWQSPTKIKGSHVLRGCHKNSISLNLWQYVP